MRQLVSIGLHGADSNGGKGGPTEILATQSRIVTEQTETVQEKVAELEERNAELHVSKKCVLLFVLSRSYPFLHQR